MSKTCPNCLHPVRTGANYCGYCGTTLVPTPQDPSPTSRHPAKSSSGRAAQSKGKAQRVSKGSSTGRSWIKVPITLLIIVLLGALAIRYWPEILVFLGQAVVFLKLT